MAGRDLEQIEEWGIEMFGQPAAHAYMEGFVRVFSLLRSHARAGAERPEFGEGIRVFSHRPHRILYRVADDEVLIVRVIHMARAPRAWTEAS